MTTYNVFRDNSLVAEKVSITVAMGHVPAGSVLTSGNKTSTVNKPEGGLEEVTEIRAVYKVRAGGHITIIQNV